MSAFPDAAPGTPEEARPESGSSSVDRHWLSLALRKKLRLAACEYHDLWCHTVHCGWEWVFVQHILSRGRRVPSGGDAAAIAPDVIRDAPRVRVRLSSRVRAFRVAG